MRISLTALISISFDQLIANLFICSPKDHLEFTIVRESIRKKLEASLLLGAHG